MLSYLPICASCTVLSYFLCLRCFISHHHFTLWHLWEGVSFLLIAVRKCWVMAPQVGMGRKEGSSAWCLVLVPLLCKDCPMMLPHLRWDRFWSLLSAFFWLCVFSSKVSVRQEAGLCPSLHSLLLCTVTALAGQCKISPGHKHNRLPGWYVQFQMPWIPSHCGMSPLVSFLWAVWVRWSFEQ